MGRGTLDNSKIHQVFITDQNGDPAGITVDTTGLATDAGQQDIVDAIENIVIPAPTGGALETTQAQILVELQTPVTSIPPIPLLTTSRLTDYAVSFTTSGDHTIMTPGAGLKGRFYTVELEFGGTATVTVKRGSTTLRAFDVIAGSTFSYPIASDPWWVTGTAEALVINTSAAIKVTGTIRGTVGA